MAAYLIYTDDSGDEYFSLHTGIMIPIDRWRDHLTSWKKYRRALYKKHGVLDDYEIHTYKWVMGKGDPVENPIRDTQGKDINTVVGYRREWATKALLTILRMEGVQIFTTVAGTANKSDAYGRYLEELDESLAKAGDWGIVVLDGSPRNPDPAPAAEHRRLPLRTRAIVEDVWVQDASVSQFIQIADLAAHSAFQHLAQNPARKFMWDWYPTHLHDRERICACR
ncbi:DUF3800 domain-containing protein [Actinoplanes sp. NPDC051494]|uniref:DUF3800 domain-containing protein n=1 Tax=Actinoplanes sp. NPDC051494 TaxID=3363907 RepID=UPI00378D8192